MGERATTRYSRVPRVAATAAAERDSEKYGTRRCKAARRVTRRRGSMRVGEEAADILNGARDIGVSHSQRTRGVSETR